jgi:hypothetical protein
MVYKFPEEELEKLRGFAVRNGVGDANTDAIRWAALQHLKSLESETQAKEIAAAAAE